LMSKGESGRPSNDICCCRLRGPPAPPVDDPNGLKQANRYTASDFRGPAQGRAQPDPYARDRNRPAAGPARRPPRSPMSLDTAYTRPAGSAAKGYEHRPRAC
jgi:hypothetical protein